MADKLSNPSNHMSHELTPLEAAGGRGQEVIEDEASPRFSPGGESLRSAFWSFWEDGATTRKQQQELQQQKLMARACPSVEKEEKQNQELISVVETSSLLSESVLLSEASKKVVVVIAVPAYLLIFSPVKSCSSYQVSGKQFFFGKLWETSILA